ncbi:MAG: class I SAM-dependent methyltransferase [Pyrinomonadaceae bacterium]
MTETDDAFKKMDRMYRLQRHFYDLSRRYYLLGRDELLDQMAVRPGERVLEAGCGTARNIIKLARRHRDASFYGLDASSAMLATARAKIDPADLTNVEVTTALADTFTHESTFGLDQPFDRIFFSFSISMIPPWRESLENAIANLRAGGRLYIVDFFDLGGLPRTCGRALWWWLNSFGVSRWDELIPFLKSLEARENVASVEVRPLFRGYSFIAEIALADPTI